MKNIHRALMSLAFLFSFNTTYAQPITQGVITYQVVNAGEGMPTSLILSFNGNKSNWEWKQNDISSNTIIDPGKNSGGILIKEKGVQYFNKLNESELLFYTIPSLKESKKTDETATIAGLKATRFYVAMTDPATGAAREGDFWVDPASTSQLPSISGFPGKMGLPLEFDILFNGNLLHVKATAVKRSTVAASLLTIPTGLPERKEVEEITSPVKIKEVGN